MSEQGFTDSHTLIGKQVLVDAHALRNLEDCARHVAEVHPRDEELCWCGLSVGISEYDLHTGWCHTLRKHFKLGEYDDSMVTCPECCTKEQRERWAMLRQECSNCRGTGKVKQ